MSIRKMQKLQQEKKVGLPENGLSEPPFREYMFIWLVQHPRKIKIYYQIPFPE